MFRLKISNFPCKIDNFLARYESLNTFDVRNTIFQLSSFFLPQTLFYFTNYFLLLLEETTKHIPLGLTPSAVALPVKDIHTNHNSPADDSNSGFLPADKISHAFAAFKINSDKDEINSDHVLSSPVRNTPVNNSFAIPATAEEINSGIALSPSSTTTQLKIYPLPSNYFPTLFLTPMKSLSKKILDTPMNPFLHQFLLVRQNSVTHNRLSLLTSSADRGKYIRRPINFYEVTSSSNHPENLTQILYSEIQPVEKEVWNAQAGADKACYLHELTIYVPQPGFDCRDDSIIPPLADNKKKKRRKLDRDPNAPMHSFRTAVLMDTCLTIVGR